MVPWFWILDAIWLQFSIFFFYDATISYKRVPSAAGQKESLVQDGNGETRQSEEEVGGKTYLEQIEY